MKIYEANGNRFLIGEEEIDVVNMCKEHHCDGYLRVHSHQMKIFNADGSHANLCVNGLHCFTQYLYDLNSNYSTYALVIGNTVYKSEILYTNPFVSRVTLKRPNIFRNHVNVGNKHLVLFKDLEKAKELCKRYDCNIDFVRIMDRNKIEVMTYERGVGFTPSCGSGNVASCAYAYENDYCDNEIEVSNPGGMSYVFIKENIEIKTMSRYVGEI